MSATMLTLACCLRQVVQRRWESGLRLNDRSMCTMLVAAGEAVAHGHPAAAELLQVGRPVTSWLHTRHALRMC